MSRVVKAKLGEDLRRVTVQPGTDIQQLRGSLSLLFAIPSSHSLKLRYADEEGDLITLSSDVELQEALSSLAPNATLRIELELIPSSSSSSSSPSHPSPSPSLSPSPSSSLSLSPLPSTTPQFYPSVAFPSTTLSPSSTLPPSLEASAQLSLSQEEKEQEKEKEKEKEVERERSEELPAYEGGEEGRPRGEKQHGGQENTNTNTDFDLFMNEFHYHRLILQTACKAAFDSLLHEYEEHHKSKVEEMWSTAKLQSSVLASTIEQTFSEWKREVSESPSAQEFSSKVSEALKGVETFTAPIIENIRVALLSTLERLFARPSSSITASEIVREMETFRFSSSPYPTPENPPSSSSTASLSLSSSSSSSSPSSSSPSPASDEKVVIPSTPQPQVIEEQQQQQDESSHVAGEEAQVASLLSSEFVYVPEEPFPFSDALVVITDMGFDDVPAIQAALVAHNGDVNGALNSLL